MKFGFIGAVAIAMTMFFTGCSDPCKDVTCVQGECVEGDCVCDAGYEGVDCGTALNAKFVGSYALNETCSPSGAAGPYTVAVAAKTGSATEVTFVGLWEVPSNIVTGKVNADGVSFSIARQVITTGFEIEATAGTITADGATMNLSYKIYETAGGTQQDACTATLTK